MLTSVIDRHPPCMFFKNYTLPAPNLDKRGPAVVRRGVGPRDKPAGFKAAGSETKTNASFANLAGKVFATEQTKHVRQTSATIMHALKGAYGDAALFRTALKTKLVETSKSLAITFEGCHYRSKKKQMPVTQKHLPSSLKSASDKSLNPFSKKICPPWRTIRQCRSLIVSRTVDLFCRSMLNV